MKLFSLCLLLICLVLSACGGNAISNAQDFSPNEAPVISSIVPVRTDGNDIDVRNILDDTIYSITVTAYDPEGAEISYSFSSGYGSFSTPEKTSTGCTVLFVTDMPKGDTPVDITLESIDPKGASTTKSIILGYGKSAPVVSLNGTSAGSVSVGVAGVQTVTFEADCDGTLQVYCDNSILSPDDASQREINSIPFTKGTLSVAICGKNAAVPASGRYFYLPDSTLADFKVWFVFADLIQQEKAVLCTVTQK